MKNLKRIVFVCVTILFLLLFLEIALRFSGKLLTYSEQNFDIYQSPYATNTDSHIYKENPFDTLTAQQKEFSYTYYLNELGLNDKHSIDSLDKDSTYIYLGDSFTFGVGAPQDSSLPALLSQQTPYTFINAGFRGSDPFFENKLIDRVFAPRGFYKYIIMINVSDLYDYIFRGGNERFLPNGNVQFNQAPWVETIHKHSYLVRAILHGVLKMDFTLLPPKVMKQKKQEAIMAYTNLLNDINQHFQGNLIVVLQPYARQYANGYAVLNEVMEFSYLNQLDELLQEKGIVTINLDKALQSSLNQSNYLEYSWPLDGHYNSKGYFLLAKEIAKQIND